MSKIQVVMQVYELNELLAHTPMNSFLIAFLPSHEKLGFAVVT